MSLRDHLQAIYDERGTLTPPLVVDAARDPQHPLHSRFDWDDTTAAEKWRCEQASLLIRSVKIAYTRPDGQSAEVRAFVPIRDSSHGPADFRPAEEAMADPFTSKLVLRAFERDVQQLKSRYSHLREFATVIQRELIDQAS